MQRNYLIQCVAGAQGVGKTYTTRKIVIDYLKKHKRPVIIIDPNNDENDWGFVKEIVSDEQLFEILENKIPVIRKIIPEKDEDLDSFANKVIDIIPQLKNCCVVLEDFSKYISSNDLVHRKKLIGSIVTIRHSKVDVIIHIQSLFEYPPKLFRNTFIYRIHYELGNIENISKSKIIEKDLFEIAYNIVKTKYINNNRNFYLYLDLRKNKIIGNITPNEFYLSAQRVISKNISIYKKLAQTSQKKLEDVVKEEIIKLYRLYYLKNGNS